MGGGEGERGRRSDAAATRGRTGGGGLCLEPPPLTGGAEILFWASMFLWDERTISLEVGRKLLCSPAGGGGTEAHSSPLLAAMSEGGGPPSPRVPRRSPSKAGYKILNRKSSWHRRGRSEMLAVSLKHWKGRRGGGKGVQGGGTPPTVYGPSHTSLGMGGGGSGRAGVNDLPCRVGPGGGGDTAQSDPPLIPLIIWTIHMSSENCCGNKCSA